MTSVSSTVHGLPHDFIDFGQPQDIIHYKMFSNVCYPIMWKSKSYIWYWRNESILSGIIIVFVEHSNYTYCIFKGVLHLWALFLIFELRQRLCAFSQKSKATSDKVSYGSGQKCSKELENYSFTSVATIVVKLQWKMCENQYFPCFEPKRLTLLVTKGFADP